MMRTRPFGLPLAFVVLIIVFGNSEAGSVAFVAGSEDAWAYAENFGLLDELPVSTSVFSFANATVDLLCDPNLRVLVVDGSFRNLDEASGWLTMLSSRLSLWVGSGGTLLYNVVPSGGALGGTFQLPFGATLRFSELDLAFSSNCLPGRESDPLFRNISCGWYGGRVSHGTLSHPSGETLLVTEQGGTSMMRLAVGYGTALMTTLTPAMFHYSASSYSALRKSALSYLLGRPQRTTVCQPPPQTGDVGNVVENDEAQAGSAQSSSNMIAVIVGVLAGAVLCALLIAGAVIVHKRRQRRIHPDAIGLTFGPDASPPNLWTPGSSTRSLFDSPSDSPDSLSPKSSTVDPSETSHAEIEERTLTPSRRGLAVRHEGTPGAETDAFAASLSPRTRGAMVIQRAFRHRYLLRGFRNARKRRIAAQAADPDAVDDTAVTVFDADTVDLLPSLAPPSFAAFAKSFQGSATAPPRAQTPLPALRVPSRTPTESQSATSALGSSSHIVLTDATPVPEAAARRIQKAWRGHVRKKALKRELLRVRELIDAAKDRIASSGKRRPVKPSPAILKRASSWTSEPLPSAGGVKQLETEPSLKADETSVLPLVALTAADLERSSSPAMPLSAAELPIGGTAYEEALASRTPRVSEAADAPATPDSRPTPAEGVLPADSMLFDADAPEADAAATQTEAAAVAATEVQSASLSLSSSDAAEESPVAAVQRQRRQARTRSVQSMLQPKA